jgi:GNAT superfamily N-acetyltransferase
MPELAISEWNITHPQWPELLTLIDQLGQRKWVEFHADWHQTSIILSAHINQTPVGFLRYVIQPIGPEEDLTPLELDNRVLREAKVLAFGVVETKRRQGIGTKLQQRLIEDSLKADCYQIRSHSSLHNRANHQLKLSLGFGVQPLITPSHRGGFYFILPLRH